MRISGAERALGIIGYLPLLFLIPVKVKRDSLFNQFHGRQSGVLFGLWLAIAFVSFILLLFVGTGILSMIVMALFFIATGLYLLFMLIGMLKVALGERYRMPVVADVALLLRL